MGVIFVRHKQTSFFRDFNTALYNLDTMLPVWYSIALCWETPQKLLQVLVSFLCGQIDNKSQQLPSCQSTRKIKGGKVFKFFCLGNHSLRTFYMFDFHNLILKILYPAEASMLNFCHSEILCFYSECFISKQSGAQLHLQGEWEGHIYRA